MRGRARPYDAQSRRAALDRLDMLATMFDTAFVLPGTNVRFGVELLLRLVPGIGDAAASALSCYLLYEAHRLGVPKFLFARMVMNVLLEGTVGAVPIAGDAFDVFSAPTAAISRCCASISPASDTRERALAVDRRANSRAKILSGALIRIAAT